VNIRILLFLLLVSLLLAFTRRWRIVGLILSAALVAILVWFTANQSVTNQDSGTSPVVSTSNAAKQVPPAAPTVTLQLSGNGAPWRLVGTIANPGDVPIRSITLNVERLDCPSSDSTQADCDVVWHGQHTLRMQIAATNSARIDESFYSHQTVPRLAGVARDRITAIGVQ
jgi:hypothetical protein